MRKKRWLMGSGAALTLTLGYLFACTLTNTPDPRNRNNAPLLAVQFQGDAKPWHPANQPGAAKRSAPLPIPAEDPMENVATFLQKSQKEAEDSIKALTQEAETLRTRLQKVEAALGKWQGVAKALQQGATPPAKYTEDIGSEPARPTGPILDLPTVPSTDPAPPVAVPDPPAGTVPPTPPLDPGDAFKLPSQSAPPSALPSRGPEPIPTLPSPEPPTSPTGPALLSLYVSTGKVCRAIPHRALVPSPGTILKISSN